MALSVLSRAQYLTAPVGGMRGPDHDALVMVKAVKGLSFNNYATMQIGGQWVRIEEATKDRALDWFAEWAAPHVIDISGPKILVPVPSSKTTLTSPADFRTAVIANKVAALCPGTVVAPVLRFKAARANSRDEGGSRSPQVIYSELALNGQLPAGRIILVDDVLTGGGHLKASAWILEDNGRTVEHALACGRTLGTQQPDPFNLPVETIDLSRTSVFG